MMEFADLVYDYLWEKGYRCHIQPHFKMNKKYTRAVQLGVSCPSVLHFACEDGIIWVKANGQWCGQKILCNLSDPDALSKISESINAHVNTHFWGL